MCGMCLMVVVVKGPLLNRNMQKEIKTWTKIHNMCKNFMRFGDSTEKLDIKEHLKLNCNTFLALQASEGIANQFLWMLDSINPYLRPLHSLISFLAGLGQNQVNCACWSAQTFHTLVWIGSSKWATNTKSLLS